MNPSRVLSVGQCFADQYAISRTLESRFKVQVTQAGMMDEALERLQQERFDLVLVNRIFDADRSPGLDLIRRMKAEEGLRDVPVMLVSNYPESQQEAMDAGAELGFGKASLGESEMLETVGKYLTPKS